jgi:cell wall-associated NlpC family hydrolase
MRFTDLIGIPFANKGRSKETGYDCYGLVKEVYRRYGYDIPEYDALYKDYTDMCRIDELIRGNTKHYPWKEIKEPVEPCLIALRFGSPDGVVNHTAVYIGEGRFIHTRERIGVNIDRLDNPAWRRVIVGFYQFEGEKHGNTGTCEKPLQPAGWAGSKEN